MTRKVGQLLVLFGVHRVDAGKLTMGDPTGAGDVLRSLTFWFRQCVELNSCVRGVRSRLGIENVLQGIPTVKSNENQPRCHNPMFPKRRRSDAWA